MLEKNKSGILAQILVRVVVELAVGGSAPWWWDNNVFKDREFVSEANSNV